ncbi:fungal specific transcription factor domain-containing protein [Aspergillus clavatus NRRL 1]|uniref:Fungal specific transcription factor domain protein n=1 Tax=Aspergillus clavatus (strain ATCC 1007 / CBS 513.65 / DSM 816 / NCTC 3887 / NRRL 1 / QM 1276 / 107) TaxID=344612 RepID=A1C692_ASPCL|nr:fungal specific transcription factor domain protein [Aspergillus clavatus NRRL 1]EAW13913.1 fungal specific transcription factor domain protein [Aspergillus clavatus NRRL 1]
MANHNRHSLSRSLQCSGRPAPCTSCRNTNAECVFDETLDLRRKVAAKRNIEELAYYRSLLYALLDSLRSPEETEVSNVLKVIRGCPSLNNIAAAVGGPTIDTSDAAPEDTKGSVEELSSLAGTEESIHLDFHSRITLEKLCDIPLVQVPAKPWTTVTDANQLVSHLVSLYFTWDHPLLQIVDQKLFLQHMKAGVADSEFCTPLLANSMLAMASAYSDFPDVFAVPREIASRGQHFYREADRLWRAEEGRASLANIQAVALMSYVLRSQGKGQSGWLMLRQAVQLAQDFGLFHRSRALLEHGVTTDQQHVAAITAWGLFIMNSLVSMDLHRVADLKLPIAELHIKEDSTGNIMWSPYPLTNRLDCNRRPALLQYAMMKLADLTVMGVEIQEILFDKAFEMTVDELWAAANRRLSHLEKWLVVLMGECEDDGQLMPHILFLQ